MEFEWDDTKANSNLKKHGIDFLDAVSIFLDPLRLEWLDDRRKYGEDRFRTIGTESKGHVLHVVYTEREGRIRIISARLATRREREAYDENFL
jgi:hypothetical protein